MMDKPKNEPRRFSYAPLRTMCATQTRTRFLLLELCWYECDRPEKITGDPAEDIGHEVYQVEGVVAVTKDQWRARGFGEMPEVRSCAPKDLQGAGWRYEHYNADDPTVMVLYWDYPGREFGFPMLRMSEAGGASKEGGWFLIRAPWPESEDEARLPEIVADFKRKHPPWAYKDQVAAEVKRPAKAVKKPPRKKGK
jgi:hypothetical protein